jgi:hypothetical protein
MRMGRRGMRATRRDFLRAYLADLLVAASVIWALSAYTLPLKVEANSAVKSECPPELVPLCTWPEVQKLLALQSEIARSRSSGSDWTGHRARQIEIVYRMRDFGPLQATSSYLVSRELESGEKHGARRIADFAAKRALTLVELSEGVNPENAILNTLKILDLKLGSGTRASARRGFDELSSLVAARHGGFSAVLTMTEIGRTLALVGLSQPAWAYFARASQTADQMPITDREIGYPRMLALLQLTQSSAEAGFSELARAYLSKAKDLGAKSHSGNAEITRTLRVYEAYVEKTATK